MTLIALVPLLTVMLAVFSVFPMFASFQGALERLLLQNLVPDAFARPLLHSWRVAFDHPLTGVRVAAEATPPEEELRP